MKLTEDVRKAFAFTDREQAKLVAKRVRKEYPKAKVTRWTERRRYSVIMVWTAEDQLRFLAPCAECL